MQDIRLLYVEDDEDIREITEFSLEDEGFILQLCASGQDALDNILTFNPDLILLDVMMPGMDGPTTLKSIRELPEFRLTPVVFCTAKVQPSEIAQFKALGVIEVISKPFDSMELPNTIKDIWNRLNG